MNAATWVSPGKISRIASHFTLIKIIKPCYFKVWGAVLYSILAFYCYLKITLKFRNLKQQTFVTLHSFWEVGFLEQLSWVFLAQGLSWGCSQAVGQSYSHYRAWLGLGNLLPNSLTWLLAGFCSFLAVGQRLQFLIMCASP